MALLRLRVPGEGARARSSCSPCRSLGERVSSRAPTRSSGSPCCSLGERVSSRAPARSSCFPCCSLGEHDCERCRGAGERGQASVELVALLPVGIAVVLAVLQVLAAGAARELAGHAAGAGAIALLQRSDPRAAARDAVPGWSRGRMDVAVRGGRVTVRLRPPTLVPGLAGLLESTVRADAGDA